MKYTEKRKLWCVKQMLRGITPVAEISRNRNIPRMTLYRWLKSYKQYGKEGLKNKPRGVKPLLLNEKCATFIVLEWKKLKIGSPKMYIHLKKGFQRVSATNSKGLQDS